MKFGTIHPDFKVNNISKNQIYPFSRLRENENENVHLLPVNFRCFPKGTVSRDFLPFILAEKIRPRPHMNRQQRFREIFCFRGDIGSQS